MNIELLDIISTVYPCCDRVIIVDRVSDMIYDVKITEAERIFREILNSISADIAKFLLTASAKERKLVLIKDANLTDGTRIINRSGIKPSIFLASK